MTSNPLQHETPRKRRLMRSGLAVTGCGLFGLMIAGVLLIEDAAMPALTLILLAFAGLLVTVIGFCMMVVAADLFAESDISPHSDASSSEGCRH